MKLLLHIGLGKTGTTAFQRFCEVNEDVLRKSGYLYGGTLLENVVQPGLLEDLGQVQRPQELSCTLQRLDSVLRDHPSEARTLIWSNEAFSMAHDPLVVIRNLDEYVRESRVFDSWEVFVVFRRQDQWLESAYKQWALKHKTYRGRRIMSAREYVDSVDYLLDYHELVSKWRDSSAIVHACSYDSAMQAGGIVDYLVQRMGLRLPSDQLINPGQVHGSLDHDLSMLMAMYNQNFETPQDPQDFLWVLRDNGLTKNLHPSNSCFVSTELRQEVLDRCSDSNGRLEAEHFEVGEAFTRDPVADKPLYEADPVQLISRALPILVNQQRRLERQNQRIKALERRPGIPKVVLKTVQKLFRTAKQHHTLRRRPSR
ncbi:hypothetical protein DFQ14_106167 [Halopolyspora algeriensis]|uniref:Sulfotransferase family protein n=1 Tax=Halopolyspora algeriensis TaxID=1500506 RepID=A0A368VPN1_9ACTN|nr:hypothetical protein [Halopolyspora algeriensis]RCW43689.1 hypothetical protein DFQ14_106167 [Halopolyspora algeriensis]TQM47529.1 hypothetical protein FHU43_3521 [Halopolyspora algeriensis]